MSTATRSAPPPSKLSIRIATFRGRSGFTERRVVGSWWAAVWWWCAAAHLECWWWLVLEWAEVGGRGSWLPVLVGRQRVGGVGFPDRGAGRLRLGGVGGGGGAERVRG